MDDEKTVILQKLNYEIAKLDDVESDLIQRKREIECNFDEKSWQIKKSKNLIEGIAEDWYNRNMLSDIGDMFEEKIELLKRIHSQNEEYYAESMNQINLNLKKNSQMQELFYEEILRLETEEPNDCYGENNKTN
ncbi:MAG: hypothetical protein E7257_06305 [Lachnospiraceae bacterium]|nr:hypothetical protein [Lachnospiraceae bacterium]